MDVSAISAASSSAAATAAPTKGISADFETFLKMLTVQMTNQDPTNPIDSADYAVQLATFSGVEQQVLTNDLLKSLAGQMQTSGMAEMAAWVGKEARAATPAYYDGDPITISPNPAAIADSVELIVRDSNGLEVQRKTLPVSSNAVQWNGLDDNGVPLPNGTYSFHIASYVDGEMLFEEMAEVYVPVQEVRSEGGDLILMTPGDIPILASSVSALRNAV